MPYPFPQFSNRCLISIWYSSSLCLVIAGLSPLNSEICWVHGSWVHVNLRSFLLYRTSIICSFAIYKMQEVGCSSPPSSLLTEDRHAVVFKMHLTLVITQEPPSLLSRKN